MAPEPSPPRAGRGPLIAAGVIIGLLALNWVAAVARFQVNLLYWDQWDFCAPLFREAGLWQVFSQQHGPHRQGLAFVVMSWLMEASGWDSRVESLGIAFWLVVAAVLVVIWKWRLSGRFTWADLWLPIAALAMRQYETVIVVPNASHSVFPLGLMVVAALLMVEKDAPISVGRWGAIGLVGIVALFTGFGIFVWVGLGWVAGVRLLRGVFVARCRSAIVPAAVGVVIMLLGLGAFAWGYGFNPASPGATFPHWPLSDYPKFVVLMIASRMDLALPTATAFVAGSVVLVLATGGLVHASWRLWRDDQPGPGQIAAAYLLAAGLGFAWFTASGRVHLGSEAAFAPRYTSLMLAFWLGLLAWSVAHRKTWSRIAMVVLGWALVVAPWADLRQREWADWPGTLGMSLQSRDAMTRTQGLKAEWLVAWQENGGDWRAAEQQVPLAVHPHPEAGGLDQKIGYMVERGLSFTRSADDPWSWLPWWNPLGVTWLKGMGGEHAQWMADEALLLIEGREAQFLNLRLRWVAPAFGLDHPVEIELGGRVARVPYADLHAGLSLPAPRQRSLLVLRSPDGTVPLEPPQDLRPGSFLVEDPFLTAAPAFELRGWIDSEAGLWPETSLDVVGGLHRWEQQGEWVWTEQRVELVGRVLQDAWLNVEVGSRFGPVDSGPVQVRIDGVLIEVPWSSDGLRWSIPLPGGEARSITLINPAGDQSPAETGRSGDQRRLALRLHRLSVDQTAAFPELTAPDAGSD